MTTKRKVTAPKKPVAEKPVPDKQVPEKPTAPEPVPVYVVNWPAQPPKRGPAKSV